MSIELLGTPKILNCSDAKSSACLQAQDWYMQAVVKRISGQLTRKQYKSAVSWITKQLKTATTKEHRDVHHV